MLPSLSGLISFCMTMPTGRTWICMPLALVKTTVPLGSTLVSACTE